MVIEIEGTSVVFGYSKLLSTQTLEDHDSVIGS